MEEFSCGSILKRSRVPNGGFGIVFLLFYRIIQTNGQIIEKGGVKTLNPPPPHRLFRALPSIWRPEEFD